MKSKLIIFDFWKTLVYSSENDPHKFYSPIANFGIKIDRKDKLKNYKGK